MGRESCDVVIAGARCAGSSAAAILSRAGRRVIVLDRMTFPSDQLSTHLLFTPGVAVLDRIGALPKVLAHGPTKNRFVKLTVDDEVCVHVPWETTDGIDYALCVPRTLQDMAIVEAAREAGADVRERWEVQDVRFRGGRACGVVARDPDGDLVEIDARLVVGADGRRSTVAARVGAWTPYRASRNGRGLVFRYMDDPAHGTKDGETSSQRIDGDSMGFCFPSAPAGTAIVLFMGAAAEVREARRDPEGYWTRKLALHPDLHRRFAGVHGGSKLRSTGETTAFYRVSSGPGWVLAGDAGHFKDPVVGQGMTDALKMGSTLADAIAPVLDDPAVLDAAMRVWEHERDRTTLPIYHFSNMETIVRCPSPVLRETVRGTIGRPDISNIFDRHRTPQQILGVHRLALGLANAVRADGPSTHLLRDAVQDLNVDLRVRASMRADRFRDARSVRGSEHPDPVVPDPPKRRMGSDPILREGVAA